jgi:hypothetical protein
LNLFFPISFLKFILFSKKILHLTKTIIFIKPTSFF